MPAPLHQQQQLPSEPSSSPDQAPPHRYLQSSSKGSRGSKGDKHHQNGKPNGSNTVSVTANGTGTGKGTVSGPGSGSGSGSSYYARDHVRRRSRRKSTMALDDSDLDPLWQNLDWYVSSDCCLN